MILLQLLASLVQSADTTGNKHHFDVSGSQTIYWGAESLKEFEESIEGQYASIGIPLKVVQSLPATPSLRVRVLRYFPRYSAGAAFSLSGTGGRLHYADYSGSATVDYKISNNSYSLVVRSKNFGNSKIRFHQANQINLKQSVCILTETVEVWDESTSDKLTMESLAYSVEPGVEIEMAVFDGLSFGFYMGADITMYADAFHLPGNKNAKLQFGQGQELKPDWIELNIGLKLIGLSF